MSAFPVQRPLLPVGDFSTEPREEVLKKYFSLVSQLSA